MPASSGERLCNGTVSVRPSVCLSRRATASKQQRRATGLPQLGRGRQISINSCRRRVPTTDRYMSAERAALMSWPEEDRRRLVWTVVIKETGVSLGRRSGVASGRPSYCSNCRRLCTENVQYIRLLTAAYLTTARQAIIKVFTYTWNVLPQPLKCLFTINCRESRHVLWCLHNNEQRQGCQVCVKISARLPPKASPI